MKRFLPYLVLLSILLVAFFKFWLFDFFSGIVSNFLSTLNFSPKQLLNLLNRYANHPDYLDHYLGWLIYYPLYFGLHLLFIWTLFREKPITRKWVFYGLIIVIVTLLFSIVIGKISGWLFLYSVSFEMFRNMFALPFILLVIEGGRILIRDIDRKLG